MYRNKIKPLILLLLLMFTAQNVYASCIIAPKKAVKTINIQNYNDYDGYEETDIIKKVSLKNKFKRTPEAQILSLLKKYNEYGKNNDIEKLKTLYTDDYVNNDGFNKNTMFELIKESKNLYKEVDYTTEVESINVSGDYAEVKIFETAKGETSEISDTTGDKGIIVSKVEYIDYMKKEDNKWKISSTYIISEDVSLSYGEAKYMTVEITAPSNVTAGSEYEVGVKTVLPGGTFVVGSVVNEEIVYPQHNTADIFRTIKSEELKRVLKANRNNHNEYASVSIGISRAKVEPPSVMLNMTGVSFIMKRVNVMSEEYSKNTGKV